MSKREFDFSRARRSTPEELAIYRKAIEAKLGRRLPRRGRPPKESDKYKPVSIRLHPKAIEWAKAEAKKRGVGYQTIINETLLRHTA